jgi:hypothetical protein
MKITIERQKISACAIQSLKKNFVGFSKKKHTKEESSSIVERKKIECGECA